MTKLIDALFTTFRWERGKKIGSIRTSPYRGGRPL
jgi:hypothetical protein